MSNEAAKANLADLLDSVQQQMRSLADVHQQRALLTATATAHDRRIEVTVNADGVLIQTKFADDIADLTYAEIATAMTTAVQQAITDVNTQAEQLLTPLRAARSRLPSLSEVVPGMPDLPDLIPQPITASTEPPGARGTVIGEAEPVAFDNAAQVRRPASITADTEDGW